MYIFNIIKQDVKGEQKYINLITKPNILQTKMN